MLKTLRANCAGLPVWWRRHKFWGTVLFGGGLVSGGLLGIFFVLIMAHSLSLDGNGNILAVWVENKHIHVIYNDNLNNCSTDINSRFLWSYVKDAQQLPFIQYIPLENAVTSWLRNNGNQQQYLLSMPLPDNTTAGAWHLLYVMRKNCPHNRYLPNLPQTVNIPIQLSGNNSAAAAGYLRQLTANQC